MHILSTENAALVAWTEEEWPGIDLAWIEDRAGLEAIDAAAVEDGDRRRLATYEQHLADGGRIAAAFHDGRPVSWSLLMRGRQLTFQWLHLLADDSCVFAFANYTVRPWRGHRLYNRIGKFSAARYLQDGCRWRLAAIDYKNRSSLRAQARRGSRPVGWIGWARLPRRLRIVLSDAGSGIGFFGPDRPFVYRVADPRPREGAVLDVP